MTQRATALGTLVANTGARIACLSIPERLAEMENLTIDQGNQTKTAFSERFCPSSSLGKPVFFLAPGHDSLTPRRTATEQAPHLVDRSPRNSDETPMSDAANLGPRHVPVLPAEVLELLAPAAGQVLVDATL